MVVPALARSHPCCSSCQELLSINQQKRIMEEARSVNALSKALATVKVAAEFLAVTGGDPERLLPEYVRQELRMDAGAKQFQDVPVGEGLRAGGKWDLRAFTPAPLRRALRLPWPPPPSRAPRSPSLVSMEGWRGSPAQSKEILGTWVGLKVWLGGAMVFMSCPPPPRGHLGHCGWPAVPPWGTPVIWEPRVCRRARLDA